MQSLRRESLRLRTHHHGAASRNLIAELRSVADYVCAILPKLPRLANPGKLEQAFQIFKQQTGGKVGWNNHHEIAEGINQ